MAIRGIGEAPGENEEIFDGYETAGEKARPARKLYWMFEEKPAPTHEGCSHTEKSANAPPWRSQNQEH